MPGQAFRSSDSGPHRSLILPADLSPQSIRPHKQLDQRWQDLHRIAGHAQGSEVIGTPAESVRRNSQDELKGESAPFHRGKWEDLGIGSHEDRIR
jgi:hypothetical protein